MATACLTESVEVPHPQGVVMVEDAGIGSAVGSDGGPQYAKGSWIPTRKWIAALVTPVAAVLVAWVEAGEWTTTIP